MSKEDLIPFNKMSPEEHKRLSSIGGKKSAESKRKKKNAQALLSLMLEADVPAKEKKMLESKYGIAVEGSCTWSAAINAGIIKAAADGNVSAYQVIMEMITSAQESECEYDGLSKSLEELGKQL